MQLSPAEAERFFKVWFPLLHYVNQKRGLLPSFPATWGKHKSIKPELVMPLRDALWKDDTLRESFIAENPAKLAADDLALVASWQYRVAGNMFIYRYLKKYTVFIDDKSPAHAYGVLGLFSSFEEMAGLYLPVYVKCVLLPFEDRIIYDSLLAPYSVYFGGGIRSDLNDIYRSIQERDGIITSLLPLTETAADPATLRKNIKARNKKILTAFQKHLGRAGLSPKMILQHANTIEIFAQKYLLACNPPVSMLDMSSADLKQYFMKQEANPVSFKRFVQFLRDTYRMDHERAETLLKSIQNLRE